MSKPKYQPGDKIGDRTVLERVQDAQRGMLYRVECKCGEVKLLRAIDLKQSNGCRSCGHRKYFLGQKKGTLTIVRLRSAKCEKVLVACDCGRRMYRVSPFYAKCICQRGLVVLCVDGKEFRVTDLMAILKRSKAAVHLMMRDMPRLTDRVQKALAL